MHILQDIEDNITLINIWGDIVDQGGVPFLLGGVSLDKVFATLDLSNQATITFSWERQVDTTPLCRSHCGHFHTLFLPMSQEEDNEVTRSIYNTVKRSRQNTAAVIHYTIKNDSRHNMMGFIFQPDQTRRVYFQRHKAEIKPLTKK